MKHPRLKPLWKLGWAGYLAAAILLALIAALVCGVDVRFWIFTKITSLLGIKSLFWFVSVWLPSHAMFDFGFMPVISGWNNIPPEMRFSLMTMCLVLITLQVHPKRTPVWAWLPLVLFAVIFPGLTLEAPRWLAKLLGPAWASGTFDQNYVKWQCLTGVLAFIVLLLATRSIRACIIPLVLLAVGGWLNAEAWRFSRTPPGPPLLWRVNPNQSWYQSLAWAWNPLLFASLLTWAIRARLSVRTEQECPQCGYDLRGTPAGLCPECGHAIPISSPLAVAP